MPWLNNNYKLCSYELDIQGNIEIKNLENNFLVHIDNKFQIFSLSLSSSVNFQLNNFFEIMDNLKSIRNKFYDYHKHEKDCFFTIILDCSLYAARNQLNITQLSDIVDFFLINTQYCIGGL